MREHGERESHSPVPHDPTEAHMCDNRVYGGMTQCEEVRSIHELRRFGTCLTTDRNGIKTN